MEEGTYTDPNVQKDRMALLQSVMDEAGIVVGTSSL
jgi:hypothetical protein